MKDLVEMEVRELLESYGFPEDVPVIKGSARKALNEDEPSELGRGSIIKLMEAVDTYIKQPKRLVDAPFAMSIEGIFMAQGRGTVLTGKIESGRIKSGDNLEVVGGRETITTICLGLEMFRKSLELAEVGDNVGVLVRGVKREDVRRGLVLCTPGFIKAYQHFSGKIYVLTKKEGGRHKPFVNNYTPQFFFRTANVTGTITLPEEVGVVMPGDSLVVKIKLVEKAALNVGLRFVMREGNLTIGAGVITELHTS
jgi:elongation factor Tu